MTPDDCPGTTSNNATVFCGACRAPVTRSLFEIRAYRYLRCDLCDSASLGEHPVRAEDLYDQSYFVGVGEGGYLDYDADAALHMRNARARLDLAERASGPQLRLIDVGCASGYVLDEARSRGATVVGVDISAHARAMAASRGHATASTLDDALAKLPEPDTVSFYQSLEHLADPADQVARAAEALPPGGRVVIETWNRTSLVARAFHKRWQQANPPTVIHLFSEEGLRRLVEQSGLDVVVLRATPKWVSLGLVAGIASHQWPAVGRPMVTAARKLRMLDLPLRYPLRDLVTVVARKR